MIKNFGINYDSDVLIWKSAVSGLANPQFEPVDLDDGSDWETTDEDTATCTTEEETISSISSGLYNN